MEPILLGMLLLLPIIAANDVLYSFQKTPDNFNPTVLESTQVTCVGMCLVLCNTNPRCGDVLVVGAINQDPVLRCHLLLKDEGATGKRNLFHLETANESTYLIVKEPATWHEARQGCLSRGYNLARIESDEENALIFNMIGPDTFAASYDVFNMLWIDGNEEGHIGCWIWTAPQILLFSESYTKWDTAASPPQPNGDNDNCVTMNENGYWWDRPCSSKFFYVCKKVVGESIHSIPSTTDMSNTPLC